MFVFEFFWRIFLFFSYVKIEKVPGGSFEECIVLPGVMLNKDVTHAKMRRRIENPKVLVIFKYSYKKKEFFIHIFSKKRYWIVHWNIKKENHKHQLKLKTPMIGI